MGTLSPLPIDSFLEPIAGTLSRAHLVLRAAAGAGKTTRIPPRLLADTELQVVVVEPRRIAAHAAASRVAAERGWRVGEEVGYRVRLESRVSARTRLHFVSTGVLLNDLQRDPFLDAVGVVVLDEFHERSVEVDLILAMLKSVSRTRSDLRILVMSATLETGKIAAFLGPETATLDCPGSAFPVEVSYAAYATSPPWRDLAERTRQATLEALAQTDGDVLVFLPGVAEIAEVERGLDLRGVASAGTRGGSPRATPVPGSERNPIEVLRLHGTLSLREQEAALVQGPSRRVILATNVAETSLTLPNIGAVVDSGLVKLMVFDPSRAASRLEVCRLSGSSAEQRMRRAGRVSKGRCYRLWSSEEQRNLILQTPPEITRIELSSTLLQLFSWGESDPSAFDWLDAPRPEHVASALQTLVWLGAIEGRTHPAFSGERSHNTYGLTALGRRLATLPMAPRVGAIFLRAEALGVDPDSIGRLCAVLSEQGRAASNEADRPDSSSDIIDEVEALSSVQQSDRHRWISRIAQQLSRLAKPKKHAASSQEAMRRALLAGFPDRVAKRRRPRSSTAVMVGRKGVTLERSSAVREAELFVAIDLMGAQSKADADLRVYRASAIEASWLSPKTEVEVVEFDAVAERVVARREQRYRDLTLTSAPTAVRRGEAVEALLIEAARAHPSKALGLEEEPNRTLIARFDGLAKWMPELGLVPLDETTVSELLPAICRGKTSFEQLRQVDLLGPLRERFGHAIERTLHQYVPTHLMLSTGRFELEYPRDALPILKARIQRLFGVLETPTIANGRVPLQLHLLAPNGRPQQLTTDLKGFWENTYPEVRKELRGRYPRHHWPEDPTQAPATSSRNKSR
ncbi:MAG: ATP-dependent helicase HrpB [Deltaproteobacteria bacterium CG2_30_63_29]|nr:MAG: ATP-dependent helicase HrpB [Deltaproteobacteria bacterium CG2_30_63_29]PJB44369.1 MAG: ATP-dependent helicase HrpB [Deltaproteobacteria bacterium CG_4_9_14_3_um_filter_63_12]